MQSSWHSALPFCTFATCCYKRQVGRSPALLFVSSFVKPAAFSCGFLCGCSLSLLFWAFCLPSWHMGSNATGLARISYVFCFLSLWAEVSKGAVVLSLCRLFSISLPWQEEMTLQETQLLLWVVSGAMRGMEKIKHFSKILEALRPSVGGSTYSLILHKSYVSSDL